MDLFSFSIPYLAEQVTNMLLHFVGKGSPITPLTPAEIVNFTKMLTSEEAEKAKKKAERLEALRNKIKAFARMQRIFCNLR